MLSDVDVRQCAEGTQCLASERFGAHPMTIDGVTGVHFVSWAPNAQRASVIGEFNGWDGRVHVMRHLASSGVWELFVPGVADGERYKFEVRTQAGHVHQADA